MSAVLMKYWNKELLPMSEAVRPRTQAEQSQHLVAADCLAPR